MKSDEVPMPLHFQQGVTELVVHPDGSATWRGMPLFAGTTAFHEAMKFIMEMHFKGLESQYRQVRRDALEAALREEME